MPIMVDQTDEVKQKTDIVSLISEYVDLKKAGRNYRALCPFHSEKTPSFMVSSELQIYKCFGCGESGDVYSFLQKYEGMEFYEALQFLAERVGVKLAPSTFKDREGKKTLYEINNLAGKFYQYILLKHSAGKAALNYLIKKRGLKLTTIKEFQLGYSPDSPGAISKFLVDKKRYKKDDLVRAGITYLRGSTAADRFRGRIIFPLFDHRGNICGFSGRLMPGNESGEVAKYINTPETPIYHKANILYALNAARPYIKKKGFAIVVEGELDAISSWQKGFKNIVAIKGSALTEAQASLLSRFCKKVTLALDADLAGDSAARRGIKIAEGAQLLVTVASLEGYKDPDELVQNMPDKFDLAIKNAKGVWDFIVESIFSRTGAATGEGKARISREIVPILASITDEIVKAHYIEVVAKKLGVPTTAVVNQVEKTDEKTKDSKKRIEELVRPAHKPRRELLEERLLSIAFSTNPEVLLDNKIERFIETPLAKRIIQKYKEFYPKKKSFDPSLFAENLPKELVEGFAELILKETQDENETHSTRQKEIELIKKELEVIDIKNKLEELAKLMRDYEVTSQKQKLKKVKVEFSKLSKSLTELEEKDFGSIIL